jgi:hypothetical protein
MGRQSLGYEDFMGTYPLVNIQKAVENPPFEWVNQLFLWPFSIANCNKLPEGFSDGFLGH